MVTGSSTIEVKGEHIDVHPPLGFTLFTLAASLICVTALLAITG